MKKMVSVLLIAVLFLSMVYHTPLSFAETPLTAPIIYVSRDGSGTKDYTCDGIDDHVEINKAITDILNNSAKDCHTVHLKPGIYKIKDSILMGGRSDRKITLEGEGENTVILLDKTAIWPKEKGMITESPNSENQKYFVIRNLKMDGNAGEIESCKVKEDDKPVPIRYSDNVGQDWHDLISLSNCTNVEIYGMHFTNNFNDALKITDCTNVKYHDNKIMEVGHDGLQSFRCNNVYAYNNYAELNVNCGFRIYNTNHSEVHDNIITANYKGGAGIQIQQEGSVLMNNVKVYNNKIFNTALSGIWIFGAGSFTTSYRSKVQVYNNLIYNCGTKTNFEADAGGPGGILVCGMDAEITNNTIDDCFGFGIGTLEVYHPTLTPPAMTYTINVKNNIITRTKVHNIVKDTKGYGIYNPPLGLTGVIHNYKLYNNCINGNATANTYGSINSQSNTINENPLFKDLTNDILKNRDYHLKSKGSRWNGSGWTTDNITSSSPCINAGNSNTINEPPDISGTVNLGRYGDTLEASTAKIQSPFAKVNPVADTYTEAGNPNANFGTSTFLVAKSSINNNLYRKTYMKFNFSEYTGTSATKAVLRVYGDFTDQIAPYDIHLYRTANETWNETQVTWNNNPDSTNDTFIINEATASNTSDCPIGRWYEFDVTTTVNQNMSDKTISFRLESKNLDQYIYFNSREAALRKPELIIFN